MTFRSDVGCNSFSPDLLPYLPPLVRKSKVDEIEASRETMQFMDDRNWRSGWMKFDTMVAHSEKHKVSFDQTSYTFNASTYLVPPPAFIRH